jgi:hypothetical protein
VLEFVEREAGDNAILMPFRDWIAAHRDYSAASDPAVEEALVDRANDLEMEIYRTPATGPVGLAIKGYFLGYYHADTTPEIADFTRPGCLWRGWGVGALGQPRGQKLLR